MCLCAWACVCSCFYVLTVGWAGVRGRGGSQQKRTGRPKYFLHNFFTFFWGVGSGASMWSGVCAHKCSRAFLCSFRPLPICPASLRYVCHDSFTSVPWLIHICAMTHSHLCHDPFMCALTHSSRVMCAHACAVLSLSCVFRVSCVCLPCIFRVLCYFLHSVLLVVRNKVCATCLCWLQFVHRARFRFFWCSR